MDVQSTMICDVFAMISSVATVVLQKPLDSQKNSLDLKNITRFKISALKLTVSPETISSCSSSSENLNTICKFVKNYHAEAWKILCGKASGFFQELKATAMRKCFTVGYRSITLIFDQYVSNHCTDPAKKWR